MNALCAYRATCYRPYVCITYASRIRRHLRFSAAGVCPVDGMFHGDKVEQSGDQSFRKWCHMSTVFRTWCSTRSGEGGRAGCDSSLYMHSRVGALPCRDGHTWQGHASGVCRERSAPLRTQTLSLMRFSGVSRFKSSSMRSSWAPAHLSTFRLLVSCSSPPMKSSSRM